MQDLLLLCAFLIAIAVGWCFGRKDVKRTERKGKDPAGHIKGLNYLLNEQPDEAVALFSRALENKPDTVEMQLALGKLYRSRGDVGKATECHQRLLANPALNNVELQITRFELANDYMSAGLLDRAERLLKELAEEGDELKWPSLQLLLGIYQREKEWEKATETALLLVPREKGKIYAMLAHYRCELALEHLEEGEMILARRELKKALNYDKSCVRASLIKGHLETRQGNFKDAIKALQAVRGQDPDYLVESLEELTLCYQSLGRENELERYLFACLQERPSISLVLAIARLIEGKENDAEPGSAFIAEQLSKRPSLKGIRYMLEEQLATTETTETDSLQQLHKLTAQLIESKPVYRCRGCGYAGKQLLWLCPSCHKWGEIKPIYGLEGE